MNLLRFKILMASAALCLIVAIFDSPRPPGLLDHTVWPVAYTFGALMTFIVAIRPTRSTFRGWASIMISIPSLRAVTMAFDPPLESARFASVSTNLFLAIIIYLLWDGWRGTLAQSRRPEDQMITLPLSTIEQLAQPSAETTELARMEKIDDARVYAEEHKVPNVPGL